MKPVVLLLDRDLAFTFWLGRLLDEAGYEALPARNIADARKLITDLDLLPDAVIVDHSLQGDSDFLTDLRHKQRLIKMIGLVPQANAPIPAGIDWQYSKPEATDDIGRKAFFRQIHSILAAQVLGHRSGPPPPKVFGIPRRKNA